MVRDLPRRVIKVGGSLLDFPPTRERLRRWLAPPSQTRNILLAGGGQLVNRIRDWHRMGHIGEERAHWMSVECMSLTAHLLQRWLGAPLILHPDQLDSNPAPNVVVDVQLWLRNEVDMPVGWSLTSDSIAAGLAVQLDASELILLKSRTVFPGTNSVQSLIEDGTVDGQFGRYSQKLKSIGLVNFRNAYSDIVYLPRPGFSVSKNPT